jgi:ferredoxin
MTHVVHRQLHQNASTPTASTSAPSIASRKARNMLVIDPDECIDCAVCIPECPVNAIFHRR